MSKKKELEGATIYDPPASPKHTMHQTYPKGSSGPAKCGACHQYMVMEIHVGDDEGNDTILGRKCMWCDSRWYANKEENAPRKE